jgi:hypothetical protein
MVLAVTLNRFVTYFKADDLEERCVVQRSIWTDNDLLHNGLLEGYTKRCNPWSRTELGWLADDDKLMFYFIFVKYWLDGWWILVKTDLKQTHDVKEWSAVMWLRIGFRVGLLWTWHWIIFHKRRKSSWLAWFSGWTLFLGVIWNFSHFWTVKTCW